MVDSSIQICILRMQKLPAAAQLRCTEMALDCEALHTPYAELPLTLNSRLR
jgi:hypothetical protein